MSESTLEVARKIYVTYKKDGKPFFPRSSEYLLRIHLTGSLPTRMSAFVQTLVTEQLIAKGVEPDGIEIGWSFDDPNPPTIH